MRRRQRCPEGRHAEIKESPEAFIAGTETLYFQPDAEGEFVNGRCRGCGSDIAEDFGEAVNRQMVREYGKLP